MGATIPRPGPLQYGIDQVNALYDMGYTITLFTADMEIENLETSTCNMKEDISNGLIG